MIADAQDDQSSISFYSCFTKGAKSKEFINPSAYPDVCVNAFMKKDNKPFSIRKKLLQSTKIEDFVQQQWKPFIDLDKVNIKDLESDAKNRRTFTIVTSLVAMGSTLAMFISHQKPFAHMISWSMTIFSSLLAGYGVVDILRTSKDNERYKAILDSQTGGDSSETYQSYFSKRKNIDFKRLTKLVNQEDTAEYYYLQDILEDLGSYQNEFQDNIPIDDIFYISFAGLLQSLNLTKFNNIVAFCQMNPEKNCQSMP
ncbi:MAG: hypothetical protein OXC44_03425 [Proteobacteria bacterium]|nr:hypothetical protein [Pseudomonadota bacterium]